MSPTRGRFLRLQPNFMPGSNKEIHQVFSLLKTGSNGCYLIVLCYHLVRLREHSGTLCLPTPRALHVGYFIFPSLTNDHEERSNLLK